MNKRFPYHGIYSIQGCVPTLDSEKGQVEVNCSVCKRLALEFIEPIWESWDREEDVNDF